MLTTVHIIFILLKGMFTTFETIFDGNARNAHFQCCPQGHPEKVMNNKIHKYFQILTVCVEHFRVDSFYPTLLILLFLFLDLVIEDFMKLED